MPDEEEDNPKIWVDYKIQGPLAILEGESLWREYQILMKMDGNSNNFTGEVYEMVIS